MILAVKSATYAGAKEKPENSGLNRTQTLTFALLVQCYTSLAISGQDLNKVQH